jgi:uncharacterized RDD family membrane protein YckC
MEPNILDENFRSEEPSYKLVKADQGQRLANYIVDRIAASFASVALLIVLGGIGIVDLEDEDSPAFLLIYVFFIGYYVLLEYYAQGKTLGKLLTGTKVVTEEGQHPTILNILGRTLARFIPFEPFSFLGNGNGWHDSLSRTRVINVRQSKLPPAASDFL